MTSRILDIRTLLPIEPLLLTPGYSHTMDSAPQAIPQQQPVPDLTRPYDLVIIGLGPAGCMLGSRATHAGLRVLGIDPTPQWNNTYGIWDYQVPPWLPTDGASSTPARVHANGTSRKLPGRYLILNNQRTRSRLITFDTIAVQATILSPTSVRVAGHNITAPIVDCTGATPEQPSGDETTVVQQAYGLVFTYLPKHEDNARWMDFHTPWAHTPHDEPPHSTETFGYVVPTPQGLLIEETLLLGAPTTWKQLEQRLHARIIDVLDITHLTPDGPVEKVFIPLHTPLTDRTPNGVLAFGARAGFIDPMSGYSLATSAHYADAYVRWLMDHRDVITQGHKPAAPVPWLVASARATRALRRSCAWGMSILGTYGHQLELVQASLLLPGRQFKAFMTPWVSPWRFASLLPLVLLKLVTTRIKARQATTR